jgi:hypothetical protein
MTLKKVQDLYLLQTVVFAFLKQQTLYWLLLSRKEQHIFRPGGMGVGDLQIGNSTVSLLSTNFETLPSWCIITFGSNINVRSVTSV